MDADTVTINGREYPSRYPRGVDKDLDAAWDIVDSIPNIDMAHRAWVAGQIVGTIWRVRKEAKEEIIGILTPCVE